MGDEDSSSSHFKSVTIHPAVLATSGHRWAAWTSGKNVCLLLQRAQKILNKGQPVPHVSLRARTPVEAVVYPVKL